MCSFDVGPCLLFPVSWRDFERRSSKRDSSFVAPCYSFVDMKRRIGFLLTHPIQYYSPFFRALAVRPEIDLQVFFAHRPSEVEQGQGFGVAFQWDTDLTSGYPHRFLRNVARRPARGFLGYNTPSIFWEIRRGKFDLFITQGWGWMCMVQAYLACKAGKVPLAVRSDSQLPRGSGHDEPAWKRSLKQAIYPLFIRGYDLCLPYGERSAEYLRCFGGRHVEIIPHVVDHALFARQALSCRGRRNEIRAAFGVPANAVCFLFCGKFEEKKRPQDVLLALGKLTREMGENAGHLLFVGTGALDQELRRMAVEKGVGVSFTGFLNQGEIVQAYAAADVLVLPSDYRETWGLVVNEAMACGLPAIVSDSCGCSPELVLEGVTGCQFPEGDISRLADVMKAMILEEARLSMGAAAKDRVAMHFSVPRAVDRFVQVVEEFGSRAEAVSKDRGAASVEELRKR